MLSKVIYIFLFGSLVAVSMIACSKDQPKSSDHKQQDVITTTLTGSVKIPDLILIKVRDLEKKGVLNNVVIMESFPVQIQITGPRRVISELNSMSQK